MPWKSWDTGKKWLSLSLLLVGASYFINFFLLSHLVSPYDFDHLSSYYELAWRFWRTNGWQLPQFNPYFCGGRTLAGDPQVPIFSPILFGARILSAIRVIKWEMLLQLGIGVYGLLRLLQYFKTPTLGILWSCFLFVSGGAIVSRFLVGHVTLGFYPLYPILIWLSYRLSDRNTYQNRTLFCYLLLFAYCGFYKPNFLIYGTLPLFIEQGMRSLLKREIRGLCFLTLATLFCAGLGAISYLPPYQYFSQFPRMDDLSTKFIPLYSFLSNLFFPLKAVPERLYGPVYLQRHEYSCFVGPVALWFFFLGIKRWPMEFKNELTSLLVFAGVSIWIGMGAPSTEVSLLWPYSWFRTFWPGFSSIRVPVRFWYSAYLAIVIVSGMGFTFPKRKVWQWVVVLFCFLPLLGNSLVNLFKTSLLVDPEIQAHSSSPVVYETEKVWVEGSPHLMLGYVRQGKGILNCADNLSAYQARDVVVGKLLDIEANQNLNFAGAFVNWSEIRLKVLGKAPFEFSLNFNHSPLWHTSQGKITSQLGQRLTLHSDTDIFETHLKFENPWTGLALVVSGLSAAVLFAFGVFAFSARASRNHLPTGML